MLSFGACGASSSTAASGKRTRIGRDSAASHTAENTATPRRFSASSSGRPSSPGEMNPSSTISRARIPPKYPKNHPIPLTRPTVFGVEITGSRAL